MGWQDQSVVTANIVIIEGPAGVPSGVFQYAAGTTPGPGNPPVAWISEALKDPFGNSLPAADIVSFSPGTGAFAQLAGGMVIVKVAAAQTGASFTSTGAGIGELSSGTTTTIGDTAARVDLLSAKEGSLLVPVFSLVNCSLSSSVAGAVPVILLDGLSGQLPLTQTDTSTNPNANNGTQPLVAAWTIPAGDAQAGTTYEIECPFNGTFETATLGFKPDLNGVTQVTSGGDVIGGAFFVAGTGFQGTVRVKLQILTTGAGGTANLFIDGGLGINGNRSSGTNNNNGYLSSQATAVAFNTTVSNTLGIDSVWGASVVSQTVTGHGSTRTRKGP